MPSIEDLGRLMKQQFPGRFDDRSDREVGLESKMRYPSKFLAYRDDKLAVTGSQALVPTVMPSLVKSNPKNSDQSLQEVIKALSKTDSSLSHSIEIDSTMKANIESLIHFYHPNKGRFTSWWQRGKAESREKMLVAQTAEKRQRIEQLVMLQQAAHADNKRRLELNIFIVKNALELLELKVQVSLVEKAEAEGMTVTDFSSLNKESYQAQMRMTEYERKVLIDHEIQSKERRETIEWAIQHESLGKHQEIQQLQKLIDMMQKEISAIEYSDAYDEAAKYALIKDREQTLNAYREDKRARESRLF